MTDFFSIWISLCIMLIAPTHLVPHQEMQSQWLQYRLYRDLHNHRDAIIIYIVEYMALPL